MKVTLNTLRIGTGEFVDESTGEVRPWAKAYICNDSFIDNDMFTGILDSSTSIVNKTGTADIELADEMKKYLRQLESSEPVPMVFDCAFAVVKKQQVLAIVGFDIANQKPVLVKSGVQITQPSAVKKAS